MRLEPGVRPTSDLAAAAQAQAVLLVTPAQSAGEMAQALALVLRPGAPIVLCAKGIDRESGLFLADLVGDALPRRPIAVLSGPSFAEDVSRGLPTAVTLASTDPIIAEALALSLSGPIFRVYHTGDVRGSRSAGRPRMCSPSPAARSSGGPGRERAGRAGGARLCGAHALRPRLWRQERTLMGLSGLGDLVLTCGSSRSRNFAYGEAIGRGASPSEAGGGKLAEGALTAAVLAQLAAARGVDMPIATAVARLVAGETTLDAAIAALMARPTKAETD